MVGNCGGHGTAAPAQPSLNSEVTSEFLSLSQSLGERHEPRTLALEARMVV